MDQLSFRLGRMSDLSGRFKYHQKKLFLELDSAKYLNETLAGEHIYVNTSVLLVDGKKLKLFHTMRRKIDKIEIATCEQFLLHVDLNTRKSSEPVGEVASKLQEIFK